MAQISLNEWVRYKNLLGKLSTQAVEEFRDHFFKDGKGLADFSRQEMIDYAYALVTKYGEGASALACEMYDAIATLEKAGVAPAVPAATATYKETAIAVNGCLKQSETGQLLDSVLYRLVKQAGADTTLQNAVRDGADWAWIPQGDTCMFCITLASRGWQTASKAVLKGNHAEHIHGNCDCQFCVSFGNTNVEGYDPDKYYEIYANANTDSKGWNSVNNDRNVDKKHWQNTSTAKVNAMRRENYAQNKEKIRAQHRDA